jgi:GyrI-like small molecule binding domain
VAATIRAGECGIVTVERRLAATIGTKVPMADIPHAERTLRAKLDAAVASLDVGPLGHGFTLWRPPVDGRLCMQPGILVSRRFDPVGEVVSSELPAGRAAHLVLAGPYDGLPAAWDRLFAWCEEQRLERAGINWQIYDEEEPAPVTLLYALLA